MLDDNLSIIGGGIPKYGTTNVTGTADVIHKQKFPDYSELDPYFWMFGRNAPARVTDIKIPDDTKRHLELSEDESADSDIILPTIANISDSEIRTKAVELIKALKDGNEPFEASAVINSIMDNFGVSDDESKKILYKKITTALKPTKNISDGYGYLDEDNSALVGNEYPIPKSIISSIKKELTSCSKQGKKSKGMTFAKNIVANPNISYSNMKRKLGLMKAMDRNSDAYRLYGGDAMLSFLNKKLASERNAVDSRKDSLDSTYKANNHIKSHEKNAKSDIPTLVESSGGYSFTDSDFIGFCDEPILSSIDISKLTPKAIRKIIDELLSALSSRVQMLDSIVAEIDRIKPKTPTDWAMLLEEFDVHICKFEQNGKYRCYCPKSAIVNDYGDGFKLINARNVQMRYVENDEDFNVLLTSLQGVTDPEKIIEKVCLYAIGKPKYNGAFDKDCFDFQIEKVIEAMPNEYTLRAYDMTN